MTKIYKFPIAFADERYVVTEIPNATKVLCVQTQYGNPVVWAECETAISLRPLRVASIMTGETPPADGNYIGTTQQYDGQFVLHHYLIR